MLSQAKADDDVDIGVAHGHGSQYKSSLRLQALQFQRGCCAQTTDKYECRGGGCLLDVLSQHLAKARMIGRVLLKI